MTDLKERLREGAQALLEKATGLQERIRQRAHAIWEREGRPHGRDQDHWRTAESELAGEEAAAAPTKSARKSRAAKTQETAADAPAKRARAPKPATEATARAKPAKRPEATSAHGDAKAAANSRGVPANEDRS